MGIRSIWSAIQTSNDNKVPMEVGDEQTTEQKEEEKEQKNFYLEF